MPTTKLKLYGAVATSERDELPVVTHALSYLPSQPPLWSSLLFTWYNRMIALGGEKSIGKADMLLLPRRLKSEEILFQLIQCWKIQLLKKQYRVHIESATRNDQGTPGPRLMWVLHDMIFNEFWYAGFCRLINDVLVVLGAVLIKLIIKSAQTRDTQWTFIFAVTIFVSSVAQTVLLQQFIHGSFNCGSRVVAGATALVFRATLCLRLHKMSPQKTTGEINNIQAKDSSSLREFVVFFHNLWACPLMIVACVGLLLYMLGLAGLVSCILLPALIPLESYVTKQAKTARKSVLVCSDKRMALINEMIDGIWTIKLTKLVPLIYKNVSLLRDAELQMAWRGMLIEIINTVLTRSGTLLITLVTFAVYVSIPSSTPLTADRAFAALAIINILGRPIQVIPKCVSLLSDAMVSFGRIEGIVEEALKYNKNLLDDILEEHARGGLAAIDSVTANLDDDDFDDSLNGSEAAELSSPVTEEKPNYCLIELKKASAVRMPSRAVVLRNVSFNISQPGLVIITGGNASGKTSLLLSILNELVLSEGVSRIRFKGQKAPKNCEVADGISVAYCGHDPWIVNATAMRNILLAAPAEGFVSANEYSSAAETATASSTSHNITTDAASAAVVTSPLRTASLGTYLGSRPFSGDDDDDEDEDDGVYSNYRRAVGACALSQDFDSWPDGDASMIGEKGINISGGQKQRIALARAICSPAQIFLLDAPMSGLDVTVAKHVFNEAILEQSRQRLVIMTDCTYKPEVLAQASRILAMDRGQIVFDGSYSELCKEHIIETISSHQQNEKPGNEAAVAFTSSETSTSTSKKDGAGAKSKSSKGSEKAADASSQSGRRSGKEKRTKITDDIAPANSSHGGFGSYLSYARSCGLQNISLAVLLSLAAFVAGAAGDYQVAFWTDGRFGAARFLFLYGIMSVAIISLHTMRYFMFSYSGITASRKLHDSLLQSILGATFAFFTETPSGRITSRFSVDFDVIDFSIPSSLASLVDSLLGILTGVGVVVISSPVYIFIVIPLTWQYYKVQAQYRNVSKELKKIESGAKSPLFSHFREVLGGLECVRGFRIQTRMCQQHHKMLDDMICARLNWDAANRWMGVRLDLIGSLIVSAAAFSVALMTFNGSSTGGHAGIMLSYALKATQSMTFAIRASTALENMFTSPERVNEYIAVDQEDEDGTKKLHDDDFGKTGTAAAAVAAAREDLEHSRHPLVEDEEAGMFGGVAVEVLDHAVVARDVVARYAADLPPALNGISFTLKSGRLVGVCGRTGSGKSTLTLLLARAIQDFSGSLTIFGKKHRDIPLAEYRGLVQVFPQHSYIFSGRLKEFLDPNTLYSDSELQTLLEELTSVVETSRYSNMSDDVATGSESLTPGSNVPTQAQKLNPDLVNSAGGSNLSAGQKQVVALARAALADARIVLLDEITSNMDANAAERAVNIVKRELVSRGVAVLMIAHSLDDVSMCDEVWVMSEGKIIEQGTPAELANTEGGVFAAMLNTKVGTN